MGSLVELARIAKSDPFAVEPAYSNSRIPGEKALMGTGAALVGAGGLAIASTRKASEKSAVAARAAKQRANEAQRQSMSRPKDKRRAAYATKMARNSEVADLVAHNAPQRSQWMRRFGAKTALVGGAGVAAGYGIKRLNNGA